jgi:hypothetical protein
MGRKGDRKVRQDLTCSTHGGQLQEHVRSIMHAALDHPQSLHALSHATSVTVARLPFGHAVCACEDSLRPQRKKACIDVLRFFPSVAVLVLGLKHLSCSCC